MLNAIYYRLNIVNTVRAYGSRTTDSSHVESQTSCLLYLLSDVSRAVSPPVSSSKYNNLWLVLSFII